MNMVDVSCRGRGQSWAEGLEWRQTVVMVCEAISIFSRAKACCWVVSATVCKQVRSAGGGPDEIHFHFTMCEIFPKACSTLCGAEKKSHWMHNIMFTKHVGPLATQCAKAALTKHAAKNCSVFSLEYLLWLIVIVRP